MTYTLITVLLIFAVLILVRLSMPAILLTYINRILRKHPSFHGNVTRVRMSLWKGILRLQGLRITQTDDASHIDTLVVIIPDTTVHIRLRSLLRKRIDAKVFLYNADLVYANVVKKKSPEEKPTVGKEAANRPALPSPLKKAVEKLPSFTIDLDIVDATLRYIDHTATPQLDLGAKKFTLHLSDFTNQPATPPATIEATASVYEGTLTLGMKLHPLADYLTFDMNLELKDANMVLLNDFFRSYARIDVNAGSLSVYTEMLAKDGGFKGYIKPVLKNIDIIGAEDKNDSIFKKIWERMVAVAVQGLENNKVDQLATKIEIEGRFDNPHVNILAALGGVFKNAFVRALQPSLENALSLSSVIKSAVSSTANLIKKVFI